MPLSKRIFCFKLRFDLWLTLLPVFTLATLLAACGETTLVAVAPANTAPVSLTTASPVTTLAATSSLLLTTAPATTAPALQNVATTANTATGAAQITTIAPTNRVTTVVPTAAPLTTLAPTVKPLAPQPATFRTTRDQYRNAITFTANPTLGNGFPTFIWFDAEG